MGTPHPTKERILRLFALVGVCLASPWLFESTGSKAVTTNHLFFWVEGGLRNFLTTTSNISCTRATMITMTLRENKRSLQPTAEAGNLTDRALCQVLRLLFGFLPGSKEVIIALITPTQFLA